jgi:hypothetical protein
MRLKCPTHELIVLIVFGDNYKLLGSSLSNFFSESCPLNVPLSSLFLNTPIQHEDSHPRKQQNYAFVYFNLEEENTIGTVLNVSKRSPNSICFNFDLLLSFANILILSRFQVIH